MTHLQNSTLCISRPLHIVLLFLSLILANLMWLFMLLCQCSRWICNYRLYVIWWNNTFSIYRRLPKAMPDFSWKIIIMKKSQKTQSVNFWNLQETFSKPSTANENLSPQQTLWQCVSDCPWFNISCILVPYILEGTNLH